MAAPNTNPLLLFDNSSMMSAVNTGEYKSTNLSFEEAKAIIEMYDVEDVIRCFHDRGLNDIIFGYLGVEERNFVYKSIRKMRVNQDAIVFKLYTTPSETQPVIITDDGVEAKKVQNVYVYCQLLSRMS